MGELARLRTLAQIFRSERMYSVLYRQGNVEVIASARAESMSDLEAKAEAVGVHLVGAQEGM